MKKSGRGEARKWFRMDEAEREREREQKGENRGEL